MKALKADIEAVTHKVEQKRCVASTYVEGLGSCYDHVVVFVQCSELTIQSDSINEQLKRDKQLLQEAVSKHQVSTL